MSRKRTFDPKCLELAEHFLAELPMTKKKDIEDLALDIQAACEDACNIVEQRAKRKPE